MTFARTLLLASTLALGAGAAYAQDTVIIAPEQETVIREYVVKNPGQAVVLPKDYSADVGTVVPDDVTLVPVDVPDVTYDYMVVDGRTVLVDRGTRRIVRVLD